MPDSWYCGGVEPIDRIRGISGGHPCSIIEEREKQQDAATSEFVAGGRLSCKGARRWRERFQTREDET